MNMKKYVVLSMIVCLMLSLGSCGESKGSTNEVDISKILEVDYGEYDTEKDFHHKNIIVNEVEHSDDATASSEIELRIDDADWALNYQDTLFYPVGAKKVHRYLVDGDEKKTVLISEDGKVNSILYEYTVLNIEETASPEEVLASLKAELSQYIDISKYDSIKIPEQTDASSKFGIYDYLFYNSQNGYMTDYLQVSVSDTGAVSGLSVNTLGTTDFTLNIDKTIERSAIESKLKDIYTTDTTTYEAYRSAFEPCVTIYDNQLYVQYFVVAQYTHAQNGEMTSCVNSILIPLCELQ
jgi:hypothetical protein